MATREGTTGEGTARPESGGAPPRVLLVDNYDSYTYNLYQLVGRVAGVPPVVLRNDALPDPARIGAAYTHVIVSPGPGHPAEAVRVGGAAAVLAAGLPVLGVCLGHQLLALAHGGRVRPVPPRHGLTSPVRHDDRGVLSGLPQGFRAVRYHSLAVAEVPEELEVAGYADDGVVMALRHRRLPLHGVQFHPESICAEHGDRLIGNFLGRHRAPERVVVAPRPPRPVGATLLVREVAWREPEDVFAAHFAQRERVCWLDSARHDRGLARMSYLGTPEGPRGHVVTGRAGGATVRVERAGAVTTEGGDVFGYLSGRLRRFGVAAGDAPYPFRGGYVGYLGYEQDAAFAYVERFLAFDHEHRRLYLNAVATPEDGADARDWLDRTERMLADTPPAGPPPRGGYVSGVRVPGRDWYGGAFHRVRELLARGESYEVNLTFRMSFECTSRHADLYRHLRRVNPAPYAAFLRLPEVTVLSSSPECFLRVGADGTVQARPIKGTAGRHRDRADDERARTLLSRDRKTFAENLMVTDLLRNDLGQVCQVGTVAVPSLMAVESYATVHQLVTTVRGVLEPAVDAVGCLRAAFPPGSMTGAPKLRTMEIIDEVEADPRGVYSGGLGYLSLSGEADFSVVIRAIVARGEAMSIGVGGGIVALSDVDEEYAEALLKGEALLAAVRGAGAPDAAAARPPSEPAPGKPGNSEPGNSEPAPGRDPGSESAGRPGSRPGRAGRDPVVTAP
ncbi:aminodeoxychorismate synthase component I [Rugosimonospora acidiphila]|uniref:aminodeoxychorismate synthase n=1 Tax=Rugosimonospora acidiphila TaxID=556531 RepID=A0ABP9SQU9_9ACTN